MTADDVNLWLVIPPDYHTFVATTKHFYDDGYAGGLFAYRVTFTPDDLLVHDNAYNATVIYGISSGLALDVNFTTAAE